MQMAGYQVYFVLPEPTEGFDPLSAHLRGLSAPPALLVFSAEDLGGIEFGEELLEMPAAVDLRPVALDLFR